MKILVKELMVEGLLSIQAGENPRIIEEKLKTFVPPEARRNYRESLKEREHNEEKEKEKKRRGISC